MKKLKLIMKIKLKQDKLREINCLQLRKINCKRHMNRMIKNLLKYFPIPSKKLKLCFFFFLKALKG